MEPAFIDPSWVKWSNEEGFPKEGWRRKKKGEVLVWCAAGTWGEAEAPLFCVHILSNPLKYEGDLLYDFGWNRFPTAFVDRSHFWENGSFILKNKAFSSNHGVTPPD
jgi:hypothetical protein